MLSSSDNELLTKVGPGTPMGSMMREYWMPALVSTELPAPDCDPVRVLLLGERFIAFRDSSGSVGMLAAQCPHRGASLFFGRNEEGGLRCVYHGWKFDVSGQCLDMPNEPVESNFKDKVRARSVPVVERGGLVWAYLGSQDEPPPLPALEFFDDGPSATKSVNVFQIKCNWLQALEGDIDTSHFGFLHVGHLNNDAAPEGTFLRHMLEDRAPRYKVVDTEFGSSYGAYRPAGNDQETYWRIAHYLFPFYTMIPTGLLGSSKTVTARVPLDDEHTMVYLATADEVPSDLAIGAETYENLKLLPNTTDWHGRFRSARTLDNDYDIDRDAQRSGRSFTGLDSVPLEDRAMTESMGGVLDRRHEHLGSSDVMVIRVRRRILRALRTFVDSGELPPGANEPDLYRQRSGGVVLPTGADWLTATQGLRDGTEKPTTDPALAAGV
ncbi:Rieske 2Fe-2S domain-containing protein [Amycolatopsis carbonis]|uniref:Rieske 2Fe-2S domain-containing protein n=1 Tax=Amycolatopsis carbonis TaxID=715471 RepID=A0A9Y2MS96_9PSEU|nr:Rieske 2Fe-2S domain-containing protein [Amycolatopsis sp. 2-15]WIX75683.1 Rieske 2Fe-2S domain-containing protein [Amycolatopsis sp. 2-15]